ncbi:uncharacterized protein RHOBADRAFT_54596 [Rhodotorula graminis WP1]|uniref:DUF7082 domain-containing protein n=1 Tax=Rhodotorula graminis (strain WP1) TaxID=578459 RepID=A0A0P9GKT6_RHOGW|nr:uncharacterized protein RHOBADRAFT_54596 [Rhodotorula graminis WP1]KPV74025.1 hypothetical protein RHOBADRAFT_54596 [Rhodotorula graminis WP1]
MSFVASSRDDSYQPKASSSSYDSYVSVPQGARTVPNSPSFAHGHHAPPRSAYPGYGAMSSAYDPSASTSADLLPPITDHLVSPLVGGAGAGHHSQPTSPLVGGGGGAGAYFTTFEPAPGGAMSAASAPHSRQTSLDAPRQGYHPSTSAMPRPPDRVVTPDAGGASSAPSSAPFGPSLKVVQWTPQRGDEGTQVTVILDAAAVRSARPSPVTGHPASFGTGSPALGGTGLHPSSSSSPSSSVNRRFAVLFGHAPAPTKFTRAQAIDGNGVGQSMSAGPNEDDAFVVLTAFVPARSAMSAPGERAMVYVQSVDTESNAVVEQCIVGEWDPQHVGGSSSSSAGAGGMPATPERSRLGALKRSGDDLVSGREAPGLRSPHLAPGGGGGGGGGAGSVHGSPARSQGEWGAHAAHAGMHPSPALSQHAFAGAQPPPGVVDDQQQHVVMGGAGAYPRQPELIRTSQIHAPKNGYGATLSHKVILKLQGDLNTMAMGWSNEEWTNRRRLIQFWPQQDGNVINVGFRPIAQSEYVQNAIVISCIFRDEWNECFVTSVDAIYLLEALVGSRFTVEEKNRIRRNIEGFKPQTVSKSKPDAEPFFKLIMGFPNPKPRNIEKDVKVFPWEGPRSSAQEDHSANYPIGADGAPMALPPAVTEPTDDDGTDPNRSPNSTPHLGHAQVGGGPSSSAASPRVGHQLAPSPHLGHHAHQQRNPHMGHAVVSPHLGHGGGPVASTSASPHLGVYPHSPVPGGGSSSYGAYGAGAGASGDSGSGGGQYYGSSAPQQGGQQQQHLYPADDAYGVPRGHYGTHSHLQHSPHMSHSQQQSPHLGASVNGGGGSASASGTPHLRSYSDGVQYSQAGGGGGYDAQDRAGQWPSPPGHRSGEVEGGGGSSREEP